ncbi:hypothetical protein [Mesorhizobium sp. M0767]|uniref:hypothetical protein n=1 Tax=Mesorhizobium sp. M0767 TaxID=2956995 RepID=UPI00333AD94D
MKTQEIYDTVAKHLLAQGKRATTGQTSSYGGDSCAYRGEGDTKCAAGCLIPDDLYKPDMEGDSVFHEDILTVMPTWFKENVNLIGALQNVHDNREPWEWRKALAYLARRYDLKAEALNG